MDKSEIEKKLAASLGNKKKEKTKSKKKSGPLKDLAERFNIPDEDYDSFELAFSEAVKDAVKE